MTDVQGTDVQRTDIQDGPGTGGRPPKRRPGRLRRWILRPLFWSLAALAVAAFLGQLWVDSPRGREWARSVLERELRARLDHPVSVGRVSFVLLPFTFEAWDVRIAGGPAPGTPGAAAARVPSPEDLPPEPFLVLPHAVVDLDLMTLRRGHVEIQRLRLERPEIHLEWYEPSGDNLVNRNPDRPRRDAAWDVWIDRVEIEKARVFVDHDRVEISVAADAVRTRLHGRGPLLLAGQTVAQDVEVRLPEAEPIRVSVAARGSVQRGRLDVESARIRRPGLAADVDGACVFERATWEQRKCTWNVRGTAEGGVLRELGYFDDLRGLVAFDGELVWRPVATGWRSTVRADRLDLWDRRLRDVAGVLVADRFAVRLDLEHAGYAGGTLQGDVEVDVDDATRPLSVALTFEDQRLDDLLADQGVPVDGVASRIGGRLRYRCALEPGGGRPGRGPRGPRVDEEVCRRGDGRGELFVTRDPDQPGLPLEGAFPVRIDGGVVRADSLRLQNERQSALAAGWYDLARDEGRWNYEIETADVGELLPLLPLADPGDAPSWLPTAGAGTLGGRLELGRQSSGAPGPRTDLTLRLEDVVTPRLVTRQALGSLTADVNGLWDLRLDLGDASRALHVEGDVPFAPGSDGEPMRLRFDAFRWPMADVRPWLTDLPPLPLDGEVSGRLELTLPADGPSSGSLAATLEPARLDFEGRDLPFDRLPFDHLSLEALATRFTWREGRIDVQSLDLRAPAGVVSGAGQVVLPAEPGTSGPAAGRLDLRLSSARLDLAAPPLASLRPRADLSGLARLQAHLGGSFRRPELEVHLQSRRLRLGERPLPGESRLDLVWDGATLGAAARFADALVVEGGGDLDLAAADLGFSLRADDLAFLREVLGRSPAPVAGEGADEADRDKTGQPAFGGRVAGEIRVAGPLPAPEIRILLDPLEMRFRRPIVDQGPAKSSDDALGEGAHGEGAHGEGAHGEGAHGEGAHGEGAQGEGVQGEGAQGDDPRPDPSRLETLRLANRHPIVLVCCGADGTDGADGTPRGERRRGATLRIESAELVDGATGSRVALGGAVRDVFGSPRADLEVEAEIDAAWARVLGGPGLSALPISGRVQVAGRVTGDPSSPQLAGVATLRGGAFDVPGMPQAVTDLEGSVRADGRRLRIDGIRGRFAGGRIRLGGRMTLPGPEGEPTTDPAAGRAGAGYRLTLDAEGIDLRHPDGWSLAGDAELVMSSTSGGALVSGRADLDELGWRQDLRFELGELLRELFRRRRLEVAPTAGGLAEVALNVQLSAPGAVRVDNNLAQMRGSADLFLRGDLASPVLYGEVTLEEGGTLVYNGVDYVVDRGRILFVDPYDLEAEVDLVATTRVRDFDVTLSAFGSLERLETRFSSDPPLPDVELFRLLAGGDVVDAEAQLVDPRIARLSDDESTSAAGFLYGQAASAIGDRVTGLFGLDKFRIDPLTGSDRDNLSKARITVGKRLSKDVFVTYSVDPSSNDNQRLQIEWRVAEGLTLVLTQNGDNSYAADARWDSTF